MEKKRSCITVPSLLAAQFCKMSEFCSRLKICSGLHNKSALKTCKSTDAGDQKTFLEPVVMDTARDNVRRFKAIMRACNVNTARAL